MATRFRAKLTTACLFALFLPGLAGALIHAAQAKPADNQSRPNLPADQTICGEKLVLKDGTFHIVREYKVVGDRVRYYSVERSEWEEIPSSLVDWDATRKAAAQPDQRAQQAVELAHRADMQEQAGSLDVDAGLGLPSNVMLPPGDGMFVFDGNAIRKIEPTLAKSKLNKGRFLAVMVTPLPVLSTKFTIFLDGKHASARMATAEPMFFFRTHNGIAPDFRLIRTKIKGDRRSVEVLSEYFVEKKATADEIPLTIQQGNADTFRATPGQDLGPGEYVIAQLVPNQGIDLEVWDFGVDSTVAKPAKKK